MTRNRTTFRANGLAVLAITAAAGAIALLGNGCSSVADNAPTNNTAAPEKLGVSTAALENPTDFVLTPQDFPWRDGFLSFHLQTDAFSSFQGTLNRGLNDCTSFTGLGKMSQCNSEYETWHYYYPKIMGVGYPYTQPTSTLPLATLAQFKAWAGIPARNPGESNEVYRARTNTLIYYNYTGLELGREMACGHFTDTNGDKGTACYVSNYGQQFGDETGALADAAAGTRRKNTVCISYRPALPANEQVNFYVYNGNDALATTATLDDQGDRPVPQICTNCHSGTYNPVDHLATNARFLPPDPFVLHFASSGAYSQAAQLPILRSINNIIYSDSYLVQHNIPSNLLTTDQQTEVQTLYGLASNATSIPVGALAGNNVPAGWSDTAAHQDLYKSVVKPLCQVCHSAASQHWTDTWTNMSNATGTVIQDVCTNVVGPPQSNWPQPPTMPQSAPALKALWADHVTINGVGYQSGKDALVTALGQNPATVCALSAANYTGCYIPWTGSTQQHTAAYYTRLYSDQSCGTNGLVDPAYGSGKYCDWAIPTDSNGTSTAGLGLCLDGCDPTGGDPTSKCHIGEECQAASNQIGGTCVKCGKQSEPACSTGCSPGFVNVGGTCYQCGSNADCSGTTPYCNTNSHRCGGCLSNANCPASAPNCTGVDSLGSNECGTGAGEFPGSGSNGGSGTTCLANYTFNTIAGQSYTIRTPGCTGDTYVKVSGSCVCANDDAEGLCSACTCTAATTGTATICASTYSTSSATWNYQVGSHGACGTSLYQMGEFGTWSGKVNVHHSGSGPWSVDSDCASGANLTTVSYCQKFWPTSSSVVTVPVNADIKPFTAGGGSAPTCGGVYPSIGHAQYACCGPATP